MEKIEVLHGGSLRFWGDWFGRPMDNHHKVISAVYDDSLDVLTMTFDDAEECIVCSPRGITSTEQTFYIKDANSITWSWYYYRKEHTKENRFQIRYIKENEVTVSCQKDALIHIQSKVQLIRKTSMLWKYADK